MKASRSALRDIGLVVLALVTVAAAAFVLTRAPQEPVQRGSDAPVPAVVASPSASATPVGALLIGSDDDAVYTDALQDELGWQVTSSLVAGTGFIAGAAGQSYVDRIPAVLQDADADVVVISTGTAEGETPDLRRYGANVAFVLNAVRETLPEARVVLIGPVATEGYDGTRGQLTGVAARWGAFFVDPIGRRYLPADAALLEADGTPGSRGRAEVARRVSAELERVLPDDLLPEDVNRG